MEWIKLLFKDEPFEKRNLLPDDPAQGYSMSQNNPNPFTASTLITFSLAEGGNVSIIVTNILGQQVLNKDLSEQEAGVHTSTIDLSGKPDGIYVVSLVVDHRERAKTKAIKVH